jgi:hypothetical protein
LKPLTVLLAVLVLVAACGVSSKRTQSDMDRDGQAIGAALAAADTGGMAFHLTENWVVTGGQIPKGKQSTVGLTGDGDIKAGRVKMTLKFTTGPSKPSYDAVVGHGFLYVKQQKGSSGWMRTPQPAANPLYPAALLELLREDVLLAKRVDPSSLVQQGNGFAHKYVVVPANDQLEQLDAVSLSGADEATFLKTATAEIDVFLSVSGNHLQRVEVHLLGTDPTSGEKNAITSTGDYHSAKVGDIALPAGAQDVQPAQIFG